LKGVVDVFDGLNVVYEHVESDLNSMLSEKTDVVGGRERIGIDDSDVVVVATRGIDVLTFNFIEAVDAYGDAGLIHSVVVLDCIKITHSGYVSTIDDLVVVVCVGPVEIVYDSLVEALVDHLDAICVVIGEFLSQEIYTAIDYTQRIEMDDKDIACGIDRTVYDTYILLLEEGGKRRPVSSTIGLSKY